MAACPYSQDFYDDFFDDDFIEFLGTKEARIMIRHSQIKLEKEITVKQSLKLDILYLIGIVVFFSSVPYFIGLY